MHFDLLIISQEEYNFSNLAPLTYFVTKDYCINSDFTIFINNKKISFDYVITDDFIPGFFIMKEDKKIITNQFFETSIDNIFAFGKIINSSINAFEQLNIIKDYIINHE